MPIPYVIPQHHPNPQSHNGRSGRSTGRRSELLWHYDDDPFSGERAPGAHEGLNEYRARLNREREIWRKQNAAEYYECQDKVISGELPVNTPCHGRTIRQALNIIIYNNKRRLAYYNSPKFAGERNLKKLVSTKRRLLLKGAKPKTTLSPLGRTLRYKSNAPFVDWSKWGKEIRDPRQPLLGEKKEFPPPTEENINHLETYTGPDKYAALNKFYNIPKGGRKTRKNRR